VNGTQVLEPTAAFASARRPDVIAAAASLLLLEVGLLPVLNERHRLVPMVAALAIAAVLPIVGAASRGRVDIFELGVAVSVAYVLVLPARAVVVLLDLDFGADGGVLMASPQDERLALTVATLALVAGGIAYNSRLGPRLASRVRVPRVPLIERPPFLLAAATYALGLCGQAVVFGINTNEGVRSLIGARVLGLVSATSGFLLIGLALLTRRAMIAGRLAKLTLAAAIATSIGLSVAAQFKEGALLSLLIPLVMWSATAGRRIRWRSIALVGLLGIALFSLVTVARLATVRIGTNDPQTVLQALPDQAANYNWINGHERRFRPWMPIGDPLIATSRRLYIFDALVVAVRYTPSDIPHQHGRTLERLGAGLVPRVLWPGKPSPNVGIWFSTYYWGRYVPADVEKAPQAVSHIAELWIDFGVLGSIVGLALFGVWYRFVHAALSQRDNATAALFYTVIFATVVDVTRDIPLSYLTLVQRLVVCTLFVFGLSLLSRLRQARA
jgi:hypothetical protein